MKIMKQLLFGTLFILLGVLLTAKYGWVDPVDAKTSNPDIEIINPKEAHSRFAVIAKKLMPSVVNIKTEKSVEYRYNSPFEKFFDDSPLWMFPDRNRQKSEPKVKKHIQRGEGSGFIYSTDGHIMTNSHVVEGSDKVIVKLYNGEELEAEVIGIDPETDLAVIKVNKEFDKDHIAELGDSDALWVGDWVIAIGSPYSLEQTVTVGVVSAKDRAGLGIAGGGPSFQDFIQTDAAINPGNSGGPLLDINGKVIGINAAVNSIAQGIGFAIPVNLAKKIESQLREGGEVRRGYIGIELRKISADEKEPLGLNEDENGILIAGVSPNTPAEEAGLQPADVILELNGKDIETYEKFRFNVASFAPGEEIELTILRDGDKKSIDITLADRNKLLGIASYDSKKDAEPEGWLGLEVSEITSDVKSKFNLEDDNGVVVTKVDPEGITSNKLTVGDVIKKIMYKGRSYNISNIKDFKNISEKLENADKNLMIYFLRNGQKRFTIVALN